MFFCHKLKGLLIPNLLIYNFSTVRGSWNNLFLLLSSSFIKFKKKSFGSSTSFNNNMTELKQTSSKEDSYQHAIQSLNSLQTNFDVLEKMKADRKKGIQHVESIPAMKSFLERLEIKIGDLDDLNIIHVSGTKGKGSVCAFSESILRSCGLKTGFYSSPHLAEVRERIRINGKTLEYGLFAKYFFECYNKLLETKRGDDTNQMPGYFRFMTLMAFHVFLKEKVDVVILEVGLGGTYDCTNVIRSPIVCGITKLEIDHAGVLGNHITQIASHKAGIMKKGKPAITVHHCKQANEVLDTHAKEIQAFLYHCAHVEEFKRFMPELGLKGNHQHENAALALHLTRIWCHEKKALLPKRYIDDEDFKHIFDESPFENCVDGLLPTYKIPMPFLEGLESVELLGRCQHVKKSDKLSLYLDGAHTENSMEAFVSWFKLFNEPFDEKSHKTRKILLFFITGERETEGIMKQLLLIGFDHVIFCPTIYDVKKVDKTSDFLNVNRSRDRQLKKCLELEREWHMIIGQRNEVKNSTIILPSIKSAMEMISVYCNNENIAVDKNKVIVTGSFHLVGGVLKYLQNFESWMEK